MAFAAVEPFGAPFEGRMAAELVAATYRVHDREIDVTDVERSFGLDVVASDLPDDDEAACAESCRRVDGAL